jgi:hypothetical protein
MLNLLGWCWLALPTVRARFWAAHFWRRLERSAKASAATG